MNSVAALLIFLLFRFPSPTSTHHIVFEEIGEMAGALSYIHAVIPVNISGLDHAANTFRSQIDHLRRNYNLAQTEIDNTMRDTPDSPHQQSLVQNIKYQRKIQKKFYKPPRPRPTICWHCWITSREPFPGLTRLRP